MGRSRTKTELGKDSVCPEGVEKKPMKMTNEQECSIKKEGEQGSDRVMPALKDMVRSLDLISRATSSHIRFYLREGCDSLICHKNHSCFTPSFFYQFLVFLLSHSCFRIQLLSRRVEEGGQVSAVATCPQLWHKEGMLKTLNENVLSESMRNVSFPV